MAKKKDILTAFKDQIRKDEGFVPRSFWDTDQWTYGYGSKAPGANCYITPEQAEGPLERDCKIALAHVKVLVSPKIYKKLSDARIMAFANMIYNMGLFGVRCFKKMLGYVEQEKWFEAAHEILWTGDRHTKYYDDVKGKRAERVAAVIAGQTVTTKEPDEPGPELQPAPEPTQEVK